MPPGFSQRAENGRFSRRRNLTSPLLLCNLRIARALALLSLSQLPNSPERERQRSNLILAAIRILTTEAKMRSTAAAELQRILLF